MNFLSPSTESKEPRLILIANAASTLRVLAATLLPALLLALAIAPAEAQDPVRHEFVLKNFKTESGTILPEARVVYGTYGTLNADKSNAILLPSHYMANLHGYELADQVECQKTPTQALDTSKLFLSDQRVVRQRALKSSPIKYAGAVPRPALSGDDDPRQRERRAPDCSPRSCGIAHLKAVIGFSMGAQQAFQWAVSYPTYMDKHRRDLGHGQDLRAWHRAQ